MRAAVLHATNDLRIETRPVPSFGPDDVLVQVGYNGLCGTDATEFGKGQLMVPLAAPHPGSGHSGPTVLGHEFIGTVVDAGSNARHRLGARVACGAGVSCGACPWCLVGRTNLCASYYTLGLSVDGGMADFATAPSRICLDVPESCSDLDAALAQPLAVGIHSVRRSGVRPGDSVALLGAGAIGSFIVAALAGHDGPVVAMDIDPARLAVAAELGATGTQILDRDATAAQVRDLIPEGVDVVFETSGVLGGAERAFALAVRGGTVVLVGLNKSPQPLNLADLVLREVNVHTTVAHVCDQDLPASLELLAGRKLSKLLVDRVVSLDEVVEAGLRPLVSGTATGKILVDPRRG